VRRRTISALAATSTSTRTLGVVALEAAERVGEEIDAGGGRGPELDGAGLEAGELGEFLLAGAEGGERLCGVGGEHAPGLGEAAAAAAALNQALLD
jgi:hypothetical protein